MLLDTGFGLLGISGKSQYFLHPALGSTAAASLVAELWLVGTALAWLNLDHILVELSAAPESSGAALRRSPNG